MNILERPAQHQAEAFIPEQISPATDTPEQRPKLEQRYIKPAREGEYGTERNIDWAVVNGAGISDQAALEAVRTALEHLDTTGDIALVEGSGAQRQVTPDERLRAMVVALKQGGLFRPAYGQPIKPEHPDQVRHANQNDPDTGNRAIDYRRTGAVFVVEENDGRHMDFAEAEQGLTPLTSEVIAFGVPDGYRPIEHVSNQ